MSSAVANEDDNGAVLLVAEAIMVYFLLEGERGISREVTLVTIVDSVRLDNMNFLKHFSYVSPINRTTRGLIREVGVLAITMRRPIPRHHTPIFML
jgi:hypothetical protein